MGSMFLGTLILIASFCAAQNQSLDMSGMNISHATGQGQLHDMPGMEGDGSAVAMHSMESRHMDMGPHMKMTELRAPQPGDQEKAGKIVAAARYAAEKYKDYKVALNDGFK